jgi:beta-xylosidase
LSPAYDTQQALTFSSQGGAIDPSGFQDADGTRYVVYKIDGNNIGHGGSCNNGVAPIVPTPIMLQQVESDGITLVGGAQEILTNGEYDGPLVEAPSLSRISDPSSAGGQLYILFFSSNCFR